MKGLALREPSSSLFPQGKTNHVETISAHEGTVQAFSILGMFAGTTGPMFSLLMDAPVTFSFLTLTPENCGILGLVGGILGTGISAGIASSASTANRLKKELRKNMPQSTQRFSGLKMLGIREKETVVDLGEDVDGNAVKAIVHSSAKGTKVEYITLPNPLETWDRAAAYLIEVHALAPKSSQKVLAS